MKLGILSSEISNKPSNSLWQVVSIQPKLIGLLPNLSLTFSTNFNYLFNLKSS